MADEREQGQQGQNQHQGPDDTEADPETGGQTGQGQGVTFSAEQQVYVNKLMADTRRAALRSFKDSEEYRNTVVRAQAANEVDELRAKVSRLETEKASGMARAEGILISAQLRGEAARRGVPSERIDDALILADKSNVKVSWEDGTVTGAEESLQSLVESRPWLVGSGVAPQSTAQARPAPNLNGGTHGTPASDEARIAAVMQEMGQRGMGRL